MKPEIKESWVSALRSGSFKQGEGFLQDADGKYCCLGVLCELAVTDGVVEKWRDESGSEPWNYGLRGDESDHRLPLAVMKWADLTESREVWTTPEHADGTLLTTMNDNGRSFETLARVIEEKL